MNQKQNENSKSISNNFNKENQNSDDSNTQKLDSNQEYDYFLNENEYHIDIEIISHEKIHHECRRYKKTFSFNNKLHRHFRECRKNEIFSINAHQINIFHLDSSKRVIVFMTKSELFKNLVFKS
jgi:single-stranded DNA-specific DHH superfamily exonuclease